MGAIDRQHIARISYGKDSMKMLQVIKSRGLPLDRITTTDVWATDTIPANLPPVEEFKHRMDEWIWKNYRIEVEHLCARNADGSKKTYEQMFYHVPVRRERERESKPGQSLDSRICGIRGVKLDSNGIPEHRTQGTITGFPPNTGYNYCQKLKIVRDENPRIPGADIQLVQEAQNRLRSHPLSDERPTRRKDKNIVEYIGIAADELKRFGQLNEFKRAPLVEFGIEEEMCGLYCRYAGCLSPTYESSFRDGCWFCHNQGVAQLRLLRKNYPEYWKLLMKWDLDSPVTFKADGHTVHDFDKRFELEDLGLISADDKVFRWSMLEEELNYRWF